jgi:Outer membrane protein Omp28
MKYFALFACLSGLLVFGCQEKPIPIPDLSVGARKVLVEELTGVRCGNCPDGTKDLTDLQKKFPGRVVIVATHAAPGFDLPYAESVEDFRTAAGTAMANSLGQAAFFPTAAINRRLVSPGTELYLPRAVWAGIVTEELAKPPVAGLFVTAVFNPVNRRVEVAVNIAPEQALTGEHRLTVTITQDSIVDVQKNIIDKVPNYTHRFALRTVLTQPTGDVIAETLNQRSTVTKNFTTVLPIRWDARQCRVVVWLHRSGTPNREVLQVEEVRVAL